MFKESLFSAGTLVVSTFGTYKDGTNPPLTNSSEIVLSQGTCNPSPLILGKSEKYLIFFLFLINFFFFFYYTFYFLEVDDGCS